MNTFVYGTSRTSDDTNLIWCKGWKPDEFATMGRPNVGYPKDAGTRPRSSWNQRTFSTKDYEHHFTRNIKVVDGDLPSIGWLGELMMHNRAIDGPLTQVHDEGQKPTYDPYYCEGGRTPLWKTGWMNKIDVKAKFDLFRPFKRLDDPKYHPVAGDCHTENLHMLDIFTVWDPSNDGFDNDRDGAVDEYDTGYQVGDRFGPEVRVFGRVDLNLMHSLVNQVTMPDNRYCRGATHTYGFSQLEGRRPRGLGYSQSSNWGPLETIGDMLRADDMKYVPGWFLAGSGHAWQGTSSPIIRESGFAKFSGCSSGSAPGGFRGDDDGDGVFNERDERDMLFTWIANHFTTRSNVFDVDLVVETCDPPYYAGKLPLRTYKSRQIFARKRALGVLDRSTCLRVANNGECDFRGPVKTRILRFGDDRRVP